jgi:hypothetical protein
MEGLRNWLNSRGEAFIIVTEGDMAKRTSLVPEPERGNILPFEIDCGEMRDGIGIPAIYSRNSHEAYVGNFDHAVPCRSLPKQRRPKPWLLERKPEPGQR